MLHKDKNLLTSCCAAGYELNKKVNVITSQTLNIGYGRTHHHEIRPQPEQPQTGLNGFYWLFRSISLVTRSSLLDTCVTFLMELSELTMALSTRFAWRTKCNFPLKVSRPNWCPQQGVSVSFSSGPVAHGEAFNWGFSFTVIPESAATSRCRKIRSGEQKLPGDQRCPFSTRHIH